jgi:hypothetical protein
MKPIFYLVFSACLSFPALAQQQVRSVTLFWTANDRNPPDVRYNLYRATAPGGPGTCSPELPFAILNIDGPLAALTYNDERVPVSKVYCYRVTATIPGVESAPSLISEANVLPQLFPPAQAPQISIPALAALPIVDGSIKLAERQYIDVYDVPYRVWLLQQPAR